MRTGRCKLIENVNKHLLGIDNNMIFSQDLVIFLEVQDIPSRRSLKCVREAVDELLQFP